MPTTCATTAFLAGSRRASWRWVATSTRFGPDGGAGASIFCRAVDDAGCEADAFVPPASGPIVLRCPCPGGGGRATAGLLRPKARARSVAGAYLARMAHDEAASVVAFRRMREELALFGAPKELVFAADRAAADEVRHARVASALAGAFGGAPPPVRIRGALRRRSLAAFARENVVEGCVREAFGALVARWQAANAEDARVRAAMRRISRDETRHAALSLAVARWAASRMDAREKGRVESAGRKAREKLLRDAREPAHEALVRTLGLPSGEKMAALADAFVRMA